jgi:hypothetical protein
MGYAIGDSLENLTPLEDLDIPDPRGFHIQHAELVRLGSGGVRGMGFPTFIWDYGFVSQETREAFRAICPDASAEVYITTRTNENTDAFVTYTAVMVWPQDEEVIATRRIDFRLEFRHCVEVPA